MKLQVHTTTLSQYLSLLSFLFVLLLPDRWGLIHGLQILCIAYGYVNVLLPFVGNISFLHPVDLVKCEKVAGWGWLLCSLSCPSGMCIYLFVNTTPFISLHICVYMCLCYYTLHITAHMCVYVSVLLHPSYHCTYVCICVSVVLHPSYHCTYVCICVCGITPFISLHICVYMCLCYYTLHITAHMWVYVSVLLCWTVRGLVPLYFSSWDSWTILVPLLFYSYGETQWFMLKVKSKPRLTILSLFDSTLLVQTS